MLHILVKIGMILPYGKDFPSKPPPIESESEPISFVINEVFHCPGVEITIKECSLRDNRLLSSVLFGTVIPASILHRSIAGRYRPVRVADGPITARHRFM